MAYLGGHLPRTLPCTLTTSGGTAILPSPLSILAIHRLDRRSHKLPVSTADHPSPVSSLSCKNLPTISIGNMFCHFLCVLRTSCLDAISLSGTLYPTCVRHRWYPCANSCFSSDHRPPGVPSLRRAGERAPFLILAASYVSRCPAPALSLGTVSGTRLSALQCWRTLHRGFSFLVLREAIIHMSDSSAYQYLFWRTSSALSSRRLSLGPYMQSEVSDI